MYLTLHLCPFMTLQRQVNVTASSMGLCCIHFTIQLLTTQLGAMSCLSGILGRGTAAAAAAAAAVVMAMLLIKRRE